MKKYHVALSVILLILMVQILSGVNANYVIAGEDDAIDIHNFPGVIEYNNQNFEREDNFKGC